MDFTSEASVAIILVNWNGYSFTKACLKSLDKVKNPNFQVILVENASKNPEGQQLKNEFPKILLIENQENLGFSGGNNVGIRKALEMGFSYILLLNNDTEVEPDFLELMLRKINENPKVGAVQPMICFLGEKEKIWSAGGKWNSILGSAKTLGDRKSIKDYSPSSDILDWATGCCILVSRQAILEAGLLNEQYFAYFEDVDWSLRIREKGFSILLAEKAKIYHEAGASSKKKNSEGTLSPQVFYWLVRNQFFLIRRRKSLLGLPHHLTRFCLWMLYFFLRGRIGKLRSVAKGIRDGISQNLQAAPECPH
ncbi:glycosyltransferase family 2 protein [Algoriphagus sp. CAU 1675]|uniref:glycosyltransferase family 2 protein n=1 Tax=Algoriphagus sp. CAU 1675 TaxID=3032597 RepID=UPI0023DAAF6A|nr:glycosyltransferase family 2 protein [Algoriphagus sp. CAU 1675]MDF2156439.1 glycosyltransferase family 2 protein [Algoriphagus sp. CAU 1675]